MRSLPRESGEDLDGAEAVVAAHQRIGIGRAPGTVDAMTDEGVVTDGCIAVRRSRRNVDGHARRRADVGHPRQGGTLAVDVADDDVVAASAFELVEADRSARNAGVAGKSGRVERVGEVAADDAFDVGEGVGADPRAGHRARRQIDGDAARRVGVEGAVEAGAAVDMVVAGVAGDPVVAGAAEQ